MDNINSLAVSLSSKPVTTEDIKSNEILNQLAKEAAMQKLVSEDYPLEDSSLDVIAPIGGKVSSVGAKVFNKLNEPIAVDPIYNGLANASRRDFIKSAPVLVTGAAGAIDTMSHIAPSVIGKMASKYATSKVGDIAANANLASRTHRYGILPDMDEVLKAKSAYTKEVYGVPTVDLGKYKKLLNEDVNNGLISQEIATAKIDKVSDVIKNNREAINNDKILSDFSDKIEDVRRKHVGRSVQNNNIVSDANELFGL